MFSSFSKKWFSGIFGYFFARASFTIFSFAVLLLVILLTFFRSQLLEMVEVQAKSFANTTIAATSNALHDNNFSEVSTYVMRVLEESPHIAFVVITTAADEEIIITKKGWHYSKHQNKFGFSIEATDKDAPMLHYFAKNPVKDSGYFMYRQHIKFDGNSWGTIAISMDDTQYAYILQRYFIIVILSSVFLVLGLLLFFYKSSKKIRSEISALTDTTLELESGDLKARAPKGATGEIALLSTSINSMAEKLEEKTGNITQLAQVVEQTNDAFILFDANFNIIFVNDALEKITGFSLSKFKNSAMPDFTAMLDLSLAKLSYEFQLMQKNQTYTLTRDVTITAKFNVPIDVEMRLERISNADDTDQKYLVVLSNISERKKLEAELHQLAFYDKLTGLGNRRMFQDHLHKVIKSSERNAKSFAIFFMDLDDFKNVNDTLGHETGDLLLIEVANRIKNTFRGNDVIARLGGDEFTVIVDDIQNSSHVDIAYLAEKLLSELVSTSTTINGHELNISSSLGIAIYPGNGVDTETLIRNADTAMYVAKKAGKNRYAFFDDQMNTELSQHVALDHDLKQAVFEADQIHFYLQPIMNVETNEAVGAEVLARWDHPTRGEIFPSEFIALAEKSDLIIILTKKLLGMTFKHAHDCEKRKDDFYLSANVSIRYFETTNFLSNIETLVNTYKVDPHQIQLEFTESIFLKSTDETLQKFQALKDMGFKIAFDDFGTGYSSLSYIHQFPVDVIKIDRSFIVDMLNNKKAKAIVSTICQLANTLNIEVTAEGIEQEEQVAALKELNCVHIQGDFYDKALVVSEFKSKYFP